MPLWAWLLAGFLVLVLIGWISDLRSKRRRKLNVYHSDPKAEAMRAEQQMHNQNRGMDHFGL
ncbi:MULTISPECIES: hypothetical protein [Metabacillus]|uniref:hypothetical protein n=1 Tax=Metabacillus TaxID=2675233 RepID=UPI0004938973|nr:MULTISPECIES: hypothetical protein [Metabacillus]KEZ47025.1 hypothetical protein AZ46_0221395 [Metabacillus indicus LMG 22858]